MTKNIFDQFDTKPGGSGDNVFDQFDTKDRKKPTALDSFLSGLGDAVSFGFGDELSGWLRGGFDEKARNRYMWEARDYQDAAQAANPFAYGGGQLSGAFIPGFAAGAPLRAALGASKFANIGKNFGLLSRLGVAGAVGAAGGGVYGAGSADDGDRLKAATEGAIWGAPTALIGQGIFGEILPAVGGQFAKNLSPSKRVRDEIAGIGARMGDTPADFAARLSASPDEAILGDVITGGPELMRDAALRPSKGRNDLDKLLTDRNNNIADQTAADLWDTLGQGVPKDAANRVRSLSDIQEQMAKPLYAEVYQTRVQAVPKAAKDFITFNSRSGARFNGAIEEARESMRRFLGPDVTDDVLMQHPQFWHTVLHNVEDRVGRAISAAKMDPLGAPMGKAVAEMTGDARKFNNTVRDMLGDKFKQAQDIYAGAAKSKAAEEFGADMVKAKGDLALGEVAQALAKMTPAERQHAQYGALSALEELLRAADTGTGKANVLRPIIGNQSKRRTLQHIFGQSSGFDDLMARIDKRAELFGNTERAGIGRGPQTAEKLTGAKALTDRAPSTGNLFGDLVKFLTAKGNDKYSEDVSNEIIRIMSMPVRQAEAEIAQAGGMKAWLDSRSAAARALKRMQQLPEHRTRLLTNAAINAAFSPIGGEGFKSLSGQ